MGGATLQHTVRAAAETLVADAPFAGTVQRITELACDLAPAATGARVELVDRRGRPTPEGARAGVLASGPSSGDRLSVPLIAAGVTLGTITLFAQEPGSFGDEVAADAAVFASTAAAVLANSRAYWELTEVASGLQEAMQSRALIEQAKGMVMAVEGCTAEAAFARLARASQRDNVKVRELARQIVDREHDGRLPSS